MRAFAGAFTVAVATVYPVPVFCRNRDSLVDVKNKSSWLSPSRSTKLRNSGRGLRDEGERHLHSCPASTCTGHALWLLNIHRDGRRGVPGMVRFVKHGLPWWRDVHPGKPQGAP